MPNQEPNELSERELEILKLVATGASNKEIAQKLYISSNTVKVHLRNIFAKINTASRTEAAMYAVRIGLVENATPQLSNQEDGLIIASDLELSPDDSASLPQDQLSVKSASPRRVFGNISLAVAVIILVILGSIYIPKNIIQASTSAQLTSTPQVQWYELPGLPTPRTGLAVVNYENRIYTIGGDVTGKITGNVEMYDPQANTWKELSPKSTPVTDINGALIGGLIYVPGGRLSSGLPTDITEVYNPQVDQWTRGVSLPKALSAYSIAVYEGKMYIFGGWDGQKVVNNVFVFDPDSKLWTEITSMPTARSHSGAVVVGTKIYVIGGWDGYHALTVNEVYQPESLSPASRWTQAAPLHSGRYGMGITNLANIIFIVGGTLSDNDFTTIALIPEETDWGQIENPIDKGWIFLGATNIGTRLYALGGIKNEGLNNQMWSYQVLFTISLPFLPR
jgi:DNA-binding CsgD family transcriptional regulator